MRTRSGFQVQDTLVAPGQFRYDLFTSQTRGQGCAATDQVVRTTGFFRLRGMAIAVPVRLEPGIHYGGIRIDSTTKNVSIDSSKLAGLAPGSYILQAVSSLDTTQTFDIPFVVPFLARPTFSAKPGRSSVVGMTFSVDVVATNPKGIDSTRIQFVVSSGAGVSFFRDSLLTSKLGPTDTLNTGVNGQPRRLWVRGDLAGGYALVVGAIAGDTSDLYPVVFQDRGLRFVDPSGAAVLSRPALVRNLRDTLVFRIEAHASGSRCPACVDSLYFAGSPGLRMLDSSLRKVDGIRLVGGYALVRLVATGPVRAGAFVAVGDRGDTLVWSPISFLPPRLVFVDSAGRRTRHAGSVADLGDTLAWRLELRDVLDSLCTACRDSVEWSVSDPALVVLDASGKPVSGTRLLGGCADLRLLGSAVVRGQNLEARSLLGDTVSWSPISFLPPRLVFVDSSGADLPAWPLDTLAGSRIGPVELRVRGVHGECPTCSGSIEYSSDAPGLVFLDLSGNPTTSVALVGGRARVWVSLDRAAASIVLNARHAVYDPDSLAGLAMHVDGPVRGALFDADGDGRADSLSVALRSPVHAGDTLEIRWPAADGEVRKLAMAAAAAVRVGARVEPFAPGLTTCSGLACADLGTWITSDARGNPLRSSFLLDDSVPPVARRAQLRFSSDASIPDTLVVEASESLVAGEGFSWIAWGRPSVSMEGDAVPGIGANLALDRRTIRLLVHAGTEFKIRPGDSVRLAFQGDLSDLSGNRPPLRSVWVPVEFGARPPNVDLGVMVPVRKIHDNNWQVPVGEPPAAILVRRPLSGAWTTLDGSPLPDTSRLTGIWFQANGPWGGRMLIYDNLGTFVAHLDLAPAEEAYRSGKLAFADLLDARGGVRLWLSWNGTSDRGAKVATGVYLVRLIALQATAGEPILINRTFSIGWKREP